MTTFLWYKSTKNTHKFMKAYLLKLKSLFSFFLNILTCAQNFCKIYIQKYYGNLLLIGAPK